MTDKKLESFKIGDTQKAGVSRPGRAAQTDDRAESEAHSLGFRRIETILEEDDTGAVSEGLNALLQKLEEFQSAATTNRDKAAAKKAIVAVERTADLLDYLFQTKASMQST
jgi:hypothetical protein